jgi:hypothetical protein
MRALVLSWLLLAGAVVNAPSMAAAVVNCDQVRLYLSTGRSVDDVAETMILSVDEVKKCQQAPGSETAVGKTPEKPQEEPSGKK